MYLLVVLSSTNTAVPVAVTRGGNVPVGMGTVTFDSRIGSVIYTVVVVFRFSTVVVFCSSDAGVPVPVTRGSNVSVGTATPLYVSFSQMPIDWAGDAEMTDAEGAEAEGTGMTVGKPVPNSDKGRAVSMVVVVSFSPTSGEEIPVGMIENVASTSGRVAMTAVVVSFSPTSGEEMPVGMIENVASTSGRVATAVGVVSLSPTSGEEIPVGTMENVVPPPGKVTVTVVVTTSTSRLDTEVGIMGTIGVIISSSGEVVVMNSAVTLGPRSGEGMVPKGRMEKIPSSSDEIAVIKGNNVAVASSAITVVVKPSVAKTSINETSGVGTAVVDATLGKAGTDKLSAEVEI
jgi:hypothetical protein